MSEKIGRNQPCPCGSGVKYKKCCGMEPRAPADGLDGDDEEQLSRAAEVSELRKLAQLADLTDEALIDRSIGLVRECWAGELPFTRQDLTRWIGAPTASGDLHVIPRIHPPNQGLAHAGLDAVSAGRSPKLATARALLMRVQQEVHAVLERLAAATEILVVMEGCWAHSLSEAEVGQLAPLLGEMRFAEEHPEIPWIGGEEEVLAAFGSALGMRLPENGHVSGPGWDLRSCIYELRNRIAIARAAEAGSQQSRSPVVVFGFAHVIGLAAAGIRSGFDVTTDILPSMWPFFENLEGVKPPRVFADGRFPIRQWPSLST
jgi:SEC-C motif